MTSTRRLCSRNRMVCAAANWRRSDRRDAFGFRRPTYGELLVCAYIACHERVVDVQRAVLVGQKPALDLEVQREVFARAGPQLGAIVRIAQGLGADGVGPVHVRGVDEGGGHVERFAESSFHRAQEDRVIRASKRERICRDASVRRDFAVGAVLTVEKCVVFWNIDIERFFRIFDRKHNVVIDQLPELP